MHLSATCGCGVDVHSHVIPHDFPPYLGAAVPSGWPSMAPAHACHRHVMIDGKNYRTVSDKCWSTTKRLVDLEEMGLGLQAISPMPELLSYWLPPANGAQLTRYLNEQIAQMVSESAGRLVGLGAAPLQDMNLALKELHHIKHRLGLVGVEIGSNIHACASHLAMAAEPWPCYCRDWSRPCRFFRRYEIPCGAHLLSRHALFITTAWFSIYRLCSTWYRFSELHK